MNIDVEVSRAIVFATIAAVFAFYNRLEGKTKIRIQIRDLHCLLGPVSGYIWDFVNDNANFHKPERFC